MIRHCIKRVCGTCGTGAPGCVPPEAEGRHSRRRLCHIGAHGFTLVELLVVIGILTVVIAMLLPALSSARESGRRAACLSNVRQLTQATLMYLNENHQFLPDACSTNTFESLLSPRDQVAAAWTPISPNMYVLPSIGALLSRYL